MKKETEEITDKTAKGCVNIILLYFALPMVISWLWNAFAPRYGLPAVSFWHIVAVIFIFVVGKNTLFRRSKK